MNGLYVVISQECHKNRDWQLEFIIREDEVRVFSTVELAEEYYNQRTEEGRVCLITGPHELIGVSNDT